jgi:hypothetical protein
METTGLYESMVYTKPGRSDNTDYAQGRGFSFSSAVRA